MTSLLIPTRPPARTFRESLLAMLGLFFVVLLVALDQTVVGTALPTIVAELKGFELYAWVATAYLLTSVITVPVFGRLGDYFGRKYFVIASTIVFTLSSLLCGMAHSMLFLVLARALQGIGGGMLVGTAFASVPDLFPEPHDRMRWQVIISSAFGVANAFGPSLGGFLTQYYGWRSIFYINLPIGVVSLWFLWRHMPLIRNAEHNGPIRLDWPGALLIAAALGSLQLLVELMPRYGFSGSMPLLALASAAAFISLVWWEKRCPQPLLPFEMFRHPGLAALFTMSVLIGFMLFALLFYIPLLLQGGFGLSPQEAGLLITPMVVCITIGAVTNGRLITRVPNPRIIMYAGLVLLIAASVGITTLRLQTPHWLMVLYMFGCGLGIGFVMPNLTIFTQETAGRSHLGIATAMIQSLRMVGGMLGTALVGTFVSRIYVKGVKTSLAALHADAWVPRLNDPQILVNQQGQAQLMRQLQAVGLDGHTLLEAARVSLVSAIHIGQMLSVAVALLMLWQMRRVPPLKWHRSTERPPSSAHQ